VPDPDGHDKATYIDDYSELFDFNIEVEPILQVIVGKALELSKIELIEEFEKN
jgi:radial spoke head protein 3